MPDENEKSNERSEGVIMVMEWTIKKNYKKEGETTASAEKGN